MNLLDTISDHYYGEGYEVIEGGRKVETIIVRELQ